MELGAQRRLKAYGAAGNRRQALALAEALTPAIREIVVELRPPWSWFAPRSLPGARMALGRNDDALLPPWPTLVIGCGRSAAWATRHIREWSAGRTLAVQVLDPRIDPVHWDLVIAPKHDPLRGENVLNPLGSLHPIDDAWLADGRDAFAQLAALPSPRLGVLIGGARRGTPFATWQPMRSSMRCWRGIGRRAVPCSSPHRAARPWPKRARIREAFAGLPGIVWADTTDGANPYPGILGWADRLVVTPDSVNMLCEACATGKPVHTVVSRPLPDKLQRFHDELRAARLLHDIEARTPPTQPPLRETAAVAAEVRRHLGLADRPAR